MSEDLKTRMARLRAVLGGGPTTPEVTPPTPLTPAAILGPSSPQSLPTPATPSASPQAAPTAPIPPPVASPPKLHLVVSPSSSASDLVDEEDEEDPLDNPELADDEDDEDEEPVPHLYEAKSYLLRGFGERFDCGHYNTCLTLFKGGGNAHCPVKCPHLCPPVKERATDFMRTRD